MAFAVSAIAEAVGTWAESAIIGDAVAGAVTGAVVSGVTGGNVLQGALMGGVTGGALGAFGGAGSAASSYSGSDISSTLDQLMAPASAGGAGMSNAEAVQYLADGLNSTPTALNAAIQGGASIANPTAGTLSSAMSGAGKGTNAWGLVGQGALNFLGTENAAAAAEKSAQMKADAASKAGQQQLAIYNQQQANQAPWLAAGTTALGQLSAGTQPGGDLVKPFSTADMKNVMPAFTFANDQGQVAMQNQLRAQGQTGSNVVQGAGTLAEGLASQYEGQAFNQYQATQNAEANKLQAIAGLGQTTQQTQNANLGSLGTSQSTATLGSANALATGVGANANAQQTAMTGLGNTLAQLLNPAVSA